MKKKIMILTASTGGGHNCAARAVADEIEKMGVKTVVVDSLRDIGTVGKLFDILISQGYETSAKYTPKIYGKAYDVFDYPILRKSFDINLVNSYMKKNILKIIEQENITDIVTTHPFAAVAMADMKKKREINIPINCIITDYTPHSSYISKYIDRYIAPHEDTGMILKKNGIQGEKIFPLGIPIATKMTKKKDKVELKKKYFPDDLPTVLIMGGSFGAGKIKKAFKKLQDIENDINIVVICGRNDAVKESLDAKIAKRQPKNRTLTVGFTDKMDDFYQMADIAVTKPGGLTVTECLSYELPMIVPFFIPGQEEGNRDFIVNNQLGLMTSRYYSLDVSVKSLLDDDEKIQRIKSSIRKNAKQDSAKKVAELILQ